MRLVELFCDDDFMVFSSGALDAAAASIRFDEMLQRSKEVPFAKQPVVDRSTGVIVGYSGVDRFDFEGEQRLELGYRLVPQARGMGYATEASLAVLSIAAKTSTVNSSRSSIPTTLPQPASLRSSASPSGSRQASMATCATSLAVPPRRHTWSNERGPLNTVEGTGSSASPGAADPPSPPSRLALVKLRASNHDRRMPILKWTPFTFQGLEIRVMQSGHSRAQHADGAVLLKPRDDAAAARWQLELHVGVLRRDRPFPHRPERDRQSFGQTAAPDAHQRSPFVRPPPRRLPSAPAAPGPPGTSTSQDSRCSWSSRNRG